MAEPIIPFFMKYPIPEWREQEGCMTKEKSVEEDLLYFLQLQSREIQRIYMEIRIYIESILVEGTPLLDEYPDWRMIDKEVTNFMRNQGMYMDEESQYDLIFGLFCIELIRKRAEREETVNL